MSFITPFLFGTAFGLLLAVGIYQATIYWRRYNRNPINGRRFRY